MEDQRQGYKKLLYAAFIIMLLALVGWEVRSSFLKGTLQADSIYWAKWLVIGLPLFVFWWWVFRIPALRLWARRGMLNRWIFHFLFFGLAYGTMIVSFEMIHREEGRSWQHTMIGIAFYAVFMSIGMLKADSRLLD